MNNKLFIGGVALVIGVAIGYLLLGGKGFGAYDSTTFENPIIFNDDVTLGDPVTFSETFTATGVATFTARPVFNGGQLRSYTNASSTTATSQTLVQSDILNYDTVLFTPNTGATTLTLPASSTLTSLVPTAGDMQEQCWYNATSTVTALGNLIFAAGTGIDLMGTSTNLTIGGTQAACFTFIRQTDTDIVAIFEKFQHAD